MWSLLSQLPPSPREGWALPDRSSNHYSFSVTASWKPRSPWDLAKSQGWNVKFSNSGICSTTASQHTDFSKGITGYQPLSEGALYTRLALVLAGGTAQTQGNTATTTQLTRDEPPGRIRAMQLLQQGALPNDSIDSIAISSAPNGA